MYGACIYDAANFVPDGQTDEQGDSRSRIYNLNSNIFIIFLSQKNMRHLKYFFVYIFVVVVYSKSSRNIFKHFREKDVWLDLNFLPTQKLTSIPVLHPI